MRLSSDNGRWILQGLGGLGAAVLLAVACAGGDTPPRDAELEAKLIEEYDNAVGQAGGASMAGAGGSGQGGSGGQGGSASANAGAGGSGVAAAGSTGGGAAGAGSGTYCNAPVDVLKPACGIGSGCHGAGSRLGDFGDSESAARALLDVETENGCGFYISSANPAESQILVKLGEDIPGGCGERMPFFIDALPESEIACVSDWLSQF
ncbi:MAG: hypothetical protein RL685_3614 [Pseudomonadota bacterium]